MLRTFLLITLLFLQFSCGTMLEQLVQEPRVSLANVNFGETNLKGTTVVFDLEVFNPNPLGIPLGKIQYDLQISGLSMISGIFNKSINLAANQKTLVQLPISVDYKSFGKSLDLLWKGITGRGQQTYSLNSKLHVGPFAIPFKKTGQLKLPKGF